MLLQQGPAHTSTVKHCIWHMVCRSSAAPQVVIVTKKRKNRPAAGPQEAAEPAPGVPEALPEPVRRAASDALNLASPGKQQAAGQVSSALHKAASAGDAGRPGPAVSQAEHSPQRFSLLPGYTSRPNISPTRYAPHHASDLPPAAPAGRQVKRQLPFSSPAGSPGQLQQAAAAAQPAAPPHLPEQHQPQPSGCEDRPAPLQKQLSLPQPSRQGSNGTAAAQVQSWASRPQQPAVGEPAGQSSSGAHEETKRTGQGCPGAPASPPPPAAQDDVLAALTRELQHAPVSRPDVSPEEPSADTDSGPQRRRRTRSNFQVRVDSSAVPVKACCVWCCMAWQEHRADSEWPASVPGCPALTELGRAMVATIELEQAGRPICSMKAGSWQLLTELELLCQSRSGYHHAVQLGTQSLGPPHAEPTGRCKPSCSWELVSACHVTPPLLKGDLQGTGTVAVAAKRGREQPTSARFAAVADKLPLPPVLERLERIFSALNVVYALLLNNHIQACHLALAFRAVEICMADSS